MKNPTIWESASRPLFVRSVWLETTNTGHVHHRRHFILDHMPRRLHQEKCLNTTGNIKSNAFQHSISYDSTDERTSDEEFLLIGSAKTKYQPQSAQQSVKIQQQQRNNANSLRHPSFNVKKHHSLDLYHRRRFVDFLDPFSRCSSLQDLQSSLSNSCSNPDERLAERVLNWLDLAGKMSSLPHTVETKTEPQKISDSNNALSQQLRSKNRASTALSNQRLPSTRKRSGLAGSADHVTLQKLQQRPESVNNVNIIFHKENQSSPNIRRVAQYVDFTAISLNSGRNKKISNSVLNTRHGSSPVCNRSHRSITETSGVQRVIQDALHNRLCEDDNIFTESKKQLHIFMPSLPKKYMLGVGGGEEVSSLLSSSLNELCRV